MRSSRSLVLAAAAGSVGVAALTLTACGSTAAPVAAGSNPPTASGATRPAASESSGAGAASQTCLTSELKIRLDTSAAGAAAGSSYVPLEFRNVSSRACTLPVYPTVSFAAGSAGPDIGKPAVQEHATQAQVLTLGPGQLAHAWLQIVAAGNYPASRCKPVTAQGLRVGLTTAASTRFIARAIPACAHSPQGTSILAVFPVQAGRATRGSVP